MYLEDLIDSVNLENEETEFKARLEIGSSKDKEDKAVRWLKEIVAFANTNGGVIYVGVNDKTHEVEAISHQEFDKEVNLLYDQVKSRIEPEIEIKVKEIPLPGSKPTTYIMKIEVPSSPITPVFLHIDGNPVAFVRGFGRSAAASSEQIVNLATRNERLHYDEAKTRTKANIEDFSSFGKKYEEVNEGKLTKKVLQSALMIDEEGFLTKGGALFTDSSSSPLSLVKITQYQGINRGSSLIKNSMDKQGNLFSVILESVSYIKDHTNVGFLKTDTSRKDVSAYPARSLTEGLVNAFAHRNYFIDGSQISIDIFLDRLEITSPGSLLGNKMLKREKNLSSIDPKRRNQVICNAFVLLKMMEARGSGLGKIAEDYSSADEHHKPFISSTSDIFRLTLPDLTYSHGVIGEDNENPEIEWLANSLVPYDKQVLSHCYVTPKSLVDIASYIGLAPSTHLRKDILGPLVEKGYLKQSKKGYSYYYETNKAEVKLLSDPFGMWK